MKEKESVRDFAAQLRKAFTEAYPEEEGIASAVLLQKFITRLRASITRHTAIRQCEYGNASARNRTRIERYTKIADHIHPTSCADRFHTGLDPVPVCSHVR